MSFTFLRVSPFYLAAFAPFLGCGIVNLRGALHLPAGAKSESSAAAVAPKQSEKPRAEGSVARPETPVANKNELADMRSLKLGNSGLPFLTADEAEAFFAGLGRSAITHIVKQSDPVGIQYVGPRVDLRTNGLRIEEATSLPEESSEALAFDKGYMVSVAIGSLEYTVVSNVISSLKAGTPGISYRIQGRYPTSAPVGVFVALDGGVYSFDVDAVSIAAGAGPASEWPAEVQHPYPSHLLNGFTSKNSEVAVEAAQTRVEACTAKVTNSFRAETDANERANITQSTRENRAREIEERLDARTEKVCTPMHRAMMNSLAEAARDQRKAREQLYKKNRERFAR
jgi:hypothetical protein